MTNRNRRPARTARRGRTGRNVWINENINAVVQPNNIQILDLITQAGDFMTYDTTITEVIVTDLHWSFTSIAPSGLRQMRCALIVAPKLMDAADFQVPFGDHIGSPWMGMWGNHLKLSGVDVFNIPLTPIGGLRFHAKRRFRENDSTLWLIFQNVSAGTDTDNLLSGMTRTLVHIP